MAEHGKRSALRAANIASLGGASAFRKPKATNHEHGSSRATNIGESDCPMTTQNLAWRVLLLNTKDSNPNFYIPLSIEQALREHPAVEEVFNVGYDDALPTAISQRCNLLLAVDGEELDRGLCQRLAAVCGTSALWVSEDPYERRLNVRNGELFDRVFTNDSASVASYAGRASHLPFAANPNIHEFALPGEDDEEQHYRYDLLFVGTAWPNRVRFLKTLLQRVEGLKVKLALPQNEHLPPPDLDLATSSFSWRAANSEVARFANRSRIVLTLHRDFALSGDATSAVTPGPRLFEAALAGGFQLVDASLGETATYYEIDRELAAFDDVDECVSKIHYYLARPSERLAVARAAQQRTRREHLYAHRVATLLGALERDADAARAPNARPVETAKSRRILFVCHNHISCGNYGGVEVYVDLLARNLPSDMESLIYFRDGSAPDSRLMRVLDVRAGTSRELHFSSPCTMETLTNLEREQEFARLLHDERIDLVHFHHMLGHPWSLPLVARTLGVATVTTVHDYFPACVRHCLTNLWRRYCRAAELPEETCDVCLLEHYGVAQGSQTVRRGYVTEVMDAQDLVIFVSRAAHDHTVDLLPIRTSPGHTMIEGVPIAPVDAARAHSSFTLPLRVAVPGNISLEKGGDSLCRVFSAMRDDPVEFHVMGRVDPPFDKILKSLGRPSIKILGGYRPEEACSMLAQCDVALLLSIWPETYVLTLSEAWHARVVPIVTDIGALGERVAHGINGFKVPVDEPGAVVHRLRDLLHAPEKLAATRQNIDGTLYRNLADHVEVLSGHYRRLLRKYRVVERANGHVYEPPRLRPAGGGRSFLRRPVWHQSENPTLLGPVQPLVKLSRFQRARQYVRNHGIRATVRRAVQEIPLPSGFRSS
jgi:glycosyltransferase involved in cell wall biosynthesis